MMKSQRDLINARETTRRGNHHVEVKKNSKREVTRRRFTYFDNTVCIADYSAGLFFIDKCGWDDSPWTSRVVNAYRRYFESLDGMHEIPKKGFEKAAAFQTKFTGEA